MEEVMKKEVKVPLIFKGDIGPGGFRFELGKSPDLGGNPDIVITKMREEVVGKDDSRMVPTGNFPADFDLSVDRMEGECIIRYKVIRG